MKNNDLGAATSPPPFGIEGDLSDVSTFDLDYFLRCGWGTLRDVQQAQAEINRRARVVAADVRAGLRCPLCAAPAGDYEREAARTSAANDQNADEHGNRYATAPNVATGTEATR